VKPLMDESGSATLELTILAPALLVVLSLAILAGRIETTTAVVEHAAAASARDASLARTATGARAAALSAAKESLASQGLDCRSLSVGVDTSGFHVPAGTASVVRVTVDCVVPLADLAVPGVPGARSVHASMTSPLDTYRSR
jgi:Flp pilus assembly protein TadG